MLRVDNVRMGFACNSSSSHSIVFVKEKIHSSLQDEGHYGWDDFVLADKEDKLHYIATQLYCDLVRDIGEDLARAAVKGLTGITLDGEAYVDHQSTLNFPDVHQFGKKGFQSFWEDLVKLVERDDVVILGGNDNSGDEWKEGIGTEIPLFDILGESRQWISTEGRPGSRLKAVKNGPYWTLFSPWNGAKARMCFDPDAPPLTHSRYPELVDIKITDFCPFGCKYCYQDSTKTGKHAERFDLDRMAYALGQKGVFEVAIGGGEPQLHPDFGWILSAFKSHGIVPNFTTRIIPDEKMVKSCGAFAMSIDENNVTLLGDKRLNDVRDKLVVQVVVGSMHEDSMLRVLEEIGGLELSLVLLGFKRVGRGVSFTEFHCDWIKVLQKVYGKRGGWKVGIDTALAAKHEKELRELGISKRTYTTVEGAFSMYVDATTLMYGPSSYCDEKEMVSIPKMSYDFDDMFPRYPFIGE